MNSILSKLNAQLEKYNKGCGRFVEGTTEEFTENRIVGHECIGDCPLCQAGKNATEKAIEIVKAGIKEFEDNINGSSIFRVVNGKVGKQRIADFKEGEDIGRESERKRVFRLIKETLGKIEPEKEKA